MKSVIIKVPTKSATIVATRSGTDQTVVAYGHNLRSVISKAEKSGAKHPVLAFVPRENVRYVF
jgi:pyruvate/2-oxoglutarate/acetoin dehydrogenase E1 component